MTRPRLAALALVATLALAACGGGDTTSSSSEPTGSTGAPTTGATSTELALTAPTDAANIGFTEKTLSAPADTAFTIAFDNQDGGIPHNVQIFAGESATGTPVWTPDGNALITGPSSVVYEIPALAAGTYAYNCLSHPATMVGALTIA